MPGPSGRGPAYRKAPLVNACGNDASASGGSNCFGSPPDAETLKRPLAGSGKRIVPSSDQDPDIIYAVSHLLIRTGAPAAASTRNKPPVPKYPIDLLSGDQSGRCTTAAPSILRAVPLKGWTHNEVVSSTVATNVSVSPSGETAMPPIVGSELITKRPPGGGAIWNRCSLALIVVLARNERPATTATSTRSAA